MAQEPALVILTGLEAPTLPVVLTEQPVALGSVDALGKLTAASVEHLEGAGAVIRVCVLGSHAVGSHGPHDTVTLVIGVRLGLLVPRAPLGDWVPLLVETVDRPHAAAGRLAHRRPAIGVLGGRLL